jgi:hypothetical protein
VRFFVPVDTLLQVDVQSAQGTHHDIGTDPLGEWDVTIGKLEPYILRVVSQGFAYLRFGSSDKGIDIARSQQ